MCKKSTVNPSRQTDCALSAAVPADPDPRRGEARYLRLYTYAEPVDIVIGNGPNHHRIRADRNGPAKKVTCRAVARHQFLPLAPDISVSLENIRRAGVGGRVIVRECSFRPSAPARTDTSPSR